MKKVFNMKKLIIKEVCWVCYNENKSYIIERLISTDPNDYLNNELQRKYY